MQREPVDARRFERDREPRAVDADQVLAEHGRPVPEIAADLGALNPFTGTRRCMTAEQNGGPAFREYLRWLRGTYTRWDLLLVLDRGSCHTAKATLALAAALRITFAWLPTACPELNPLEALWRDGKQHVSANRAHPDLDAHAAAFAAHVCGHDDRTALRLSGGPHEALARASRFVRHGIEDNE